MRTFKDGETITIEPWRARAFPVIKDLLLTVRHLTGSNKLGAMYRLTPVEYRMRTKYRYPRKSLMKLLIPQPVLHVVHVLACKNSSAMLFVSAKISQLALLPQGKPERKERAERMVAQMDAEGFGACTNTGACEAECPKSISLSNIARMNREYFSATLTSYEVQLKGGD